MKRRFDRLRWGDASSHAPWILRFPLRAAPAQPPRPPPALGQRVKGLAARVLIGRAGKGLSVNWLSRGGQWEVLAGVSANGSGVSSRRLGRGCGGGRPDKVVELIETEGAPEGYQSWWGVRVTVLCVVYILCSLYELALVQTIRTRDVCSTLSGR